MTLDEIPRMNLPQESGDYKVLQLENGEPLLRFAIVPTEFGDYHETILQRFAKEIEVQCEQREGIRNSVAVLPANSPYRLCGAGMCTVDLEGRTLAFSGHSRDYNVGINTEHLRKLQSLSPDLTFNST